MMAYNFMQILFEGLEPYSLSAGVTITDKELGRGSYATVLELEYLGLKCAGKKIHEILIEQEENSMIYAVRRFKDECQILSQVRHPNIVQFLGVLFQQGDHIPILVTEFLPMNLDQCLDRYNLPKERRYSILHDVALGLNYLHSQYSPIIHRDLSSNNVLLTFNMGAKISDLGVARILNLSPQKVTYLTKAPGTPAFMPPEAMIADPKYDTSIDIFSYGILMIHTLSGKIPVPQIESIRTEGDCLIPVSEAERREPFLEVIGKDHPLMDLILKCIHNNPEMRANTGEIVDRLADTVELHPISFTNQLDMIEYISRLEEEAEGMERENHEYINSQSLENAKRTREAISKLEKMQEEARTKLQTLQHSMEKAIDHLKASLTDEVQKVLNCRAQSTTHDLDELREELKRVESSTVIPRSPVSRQRRIYENMPPTMLNVIKDSEAKSNEYTRKSGSEPRIRKRSSSTSIIKERPCAKSQSPQPRPKSLSSAFDSAPTDGDSGLQHTKVAQKNTTGEGKTSQQATRAAGKSRSVPDTSVIVKQTTRSKSGTRDDVCLVNAMKHPSKVGSKPSPPPVAERKRPQPGQGHIPMLPKRTERSITTSISELELSTQQDIEPRYFHVEKEEGSAKNDKSHRRITSDTAAIKVDPKKPPKPKERPMALQAHSLSILSEHGESKSSNSVSDYHDVSPEDEFSHDISIKESSDDLLYPIYTAKLDYEATSPSELSFRKGDQMHIKSKGKGKTWQASLNGEEGRVPKSHISALDDEEWFLGKMDSSTAKRFIMTSSNQFGSFLVRQNKDTGIFSVTIRDEDKPRHYHIRKQENGMLYFSQQNTFRSISDLIRHHSKSASGLFTMLTKPCIVPHCIPNRDEVTCKEKIAKGQFSEEWKGEWRGEVVTVHTIAPGSETSFDLLDRCTFLKSMEHENLIQFLAVYMNSEPFLVITEHPVNGSLKKYLPTRGKDLKLAELINILEQVAAAMQYLEERNCIHHNLAAKNVMIEINDVEKFSVTCKLRIFPYVHKVTNYGTFHKLPPGTIPIRWSPHEAIVNDQINIKSNVWSFGITTWEIVNYCRSYPYPETSEAGVLEKLKRGYRMPRPLGCPVELYRLMSDCWKGYANSRPTFETLHQRLKEFYSSKSFGYEEL